MSQARSFVIERPLDEGDLFVGRFSELLSAAQQVKRGKTLLFVFGARRPGVTSFLNQLQTELVSRVRVLRAETTGHSADPDAVLALVSAAIEQVKPPAGSNPDTGTAPGRREQAVETPQHCVVLLDGLPVTALFGDKGDQWVSAILSYLKARPWLQLVAAVRGCRPRDGGPLSPRAANVPAVELVGLTLEETEQLLTAMGVDPDIDALSDLTDQFEGWPAGLRLAGLVMTSRRSGFEVPANRLGSIEYVSDYVAEEWFGALKAADQHLLMELGCLGRFSGDSCEEILGISDAAATLRRLCREEVVLFALDQHGDWYRLHPLLRRWLCSRLRSQNRGRWSEIQVAAARWWERQGDADLAIEHAVTGEQLDLCEELITTHAGLYAVRGMYTTVQRWLANLGDARVRSSPRLRIVASTIAVYLGDGEAALRWARLAWEELNSTEVSAAHTDNLTMLQAEALRAGLEMLPAAEVLPLASHAYHLLPAGPFKAIAAVVLGANRYIAGDERADDTLRQALFENDVGDWSILNAMAAGALAIVLDLEGQRDEAAGLSTRALKLLATRPGETYPATGLTMAIASLFDARAGRQQQAAERIALSRTRLDALDNCAPWYRILGLVTLVRTCLLLDDAQTALKLLQQLELSMVIQDETTPFAKHVDGLHDRVQAANELSAERLWSLTAAELRVAQYLPTNLSLSDIATRLYVSRNTVKSHAAAIYRKLGTSSRGEAVRLARSAGLIGDTPPSD